jgi:hypothetical protein
MEEIYSHIRAPLGHGLPFNANYGVIYREFFKPLAEILHCSTTLASETAPYGAVTDGEPIINGYLKEVRLGSNGETIFDLTILASSVAV